MIQPISTQVPTHIEYLDLSFNTFSGLQENSFQIATNWNTNIGRTLKLRQCGLSTIHANSLKVIPKLRVLDMSGNPGIGPGVWAAALNDLDALEELSLAGCSLRRLKRIFQGYDKRALKSLNVSNNTISNLPNNTFQNEFTLQFLDLSHNDLTQLTPGFDNLKNLETLNISYNVLTSFTGATVGKMPKLNSLWLSHNRLSGDSSLSISELPLRELVVDNNMLTATPLPSNTSGLERLDVHHNEITDFPDFETARSLQYVDFSNNLLRALHSYIFKDAHVIKVARFSHNKISSVNDNAFLPHSPLVLDLSHNSLADLNTPHWVATQELSLAGNQLSSLSASTFFGMKGLLKLDISKNKLVFLHENLFQHLDALVHLDASHNKLGGKSKEGAQDIIFWTRLLKNLAALTTLNLGNNNISKLDEDSFNRLESLKTLYINDNKLTTIYPVIFRDRSDLEALDLSGNPFDCSCDLLAFRDWLTRTRIPVLGIEVVGANSTYNCSTPNSRRNNHVKGWSADEFECNQATFYLIVFGSLAVFLIIAVFVGIGLFRIYRQWRAKKKESERRRARILRELEEVQRGKYGPDREEELVLVSREIAAEIEDALERKKKLDQKHKGTKQRKGSYIPWPLKGRKGYKHVEESARTAEELGTNKSWGDGLDRRERREPVENRYDTNPTRGSPHWPRSNARPTGHLENPQRDREIPRVVKLDQHYPYVVKEAVPVAEKVEWAPKPRYQDDRYRYRPEPALRQAHHQYNPYKKDADPMGQPTVWTTNNDYRPTKYWTLPNRSSREEIRYGDDLRVHLHRSKQPYPQSTPRGTGVRFEEQQYYADPRPGSYEYWRRNHGNRSLSQGYLGGDNYGDDDPRERDRAQRQYESIENHQRGRAGFGQRSSSQPSLAQNNTSGWL